jgi:hypothetical protein
MTEAERRAYYAESERREAKAQALLLSMLNETQCQTHARSRCFQVRGSHGTLYRIGTDSYSGNVDWLDGRGRSGGNFCGHSDFDRVTDLMLPRADHHLAQMLELVTDELRWLNTACRVDGDYPPAWHAAAKGEQP